VYLADNPFMKAMGDTRQSFGNKGAKQLSIIMPCYNCEDLLEEALESLEGQTRKDFRLICINDGSTDSTPEILDRWLKKSRFSMTVIHQKNGGVSRARNRGLEKADTKWVAFLDADDIYHPNYVEKLLDAAEKADADTAYCPLSRNLDEVWAAEPTVEAVSHTPKQAMENLLYHMGQYGFYCYLYRRDLLGDQRFDENTKFGEDREFNWRYLCRCQKISRVDLPLYGYRINNASATQRCASWRKTDLLQAVRRVETYMDEIGYEYREEFRDYMFPRAMWAVAKTFANARDRELFDRLAREYDVKKCMKRTSKDSSLLVAIASRMYRLHPGLFYKAIGMKK
jgi:glycosyltransferase involved in cell wall biosynthesis